MPYRRAIESDIPRILEIARARYPSFDEDEAKAWGREKLGAHDHVGVISEHAFGIATITRFFWDQSRRGVLIFLASEKSYGLEAYNILKFMIAWARDNECRDFHFSDSTGYDLGPFAHRLGAQLAGRSYILRL